MNTSLTRSIGFWLLIVLSLASAGVGGWLIAGQVGGMTSTLLDGTATGVDVYVGQSLVVVGSALLGSGVLGLLVALALLAARTLVPAPAPVVAEPVDETSEEAPDDHDPHAQTAGGITSDDEDPAPIAAGQQPADDDDAQNGSSGSIATATKISVK